MRPVFLLAVAEDCFEKVARQSPAAGLRRHVKIVQQPAPAARDRLRQVEDDSEGHQFGIHESAPAQHIGVRQQGRGKAAAVAAVLAVGHFRGIGAAKIFKAGAVFRREAPNVMLHVGSH